jgi:hypothetical protein
MYDDGSVMPICYHVLTLCRYFLVSAGPGVPVMHSDVCLLSIVVVQVRRARCVPEVIDHGLFPGSGRPTRRRR